MSLPENILIAFILGIINAIFIYFFRYRKKKYGIYSTGILVVLFLFYLLYYTIPFKGSIDEKQRLFQIENERIEEEFPTSKKLSGDILHEERKIKEHLNNLDKLLRITSIQAIICIVLSLWGLIAVYNRNRYYTKMLLIHSLAFCLCAGLEITEHFTN